MIKITNGPLSVAGSLTFVKRGTTILSSRAFAEAPDTDFSGVSYPIVLDPSLVTGTGKFAIVYSPLPLYRYVGATVSWSSTPSPLRTATVDTPAGEGDRVLINNTVYYAVVVTIA